MTEMKEYIQKYSDLLPVGTSVSYTEAERRAGEFLSAMAMITEWRHLLTSDKIKKLSIQTAVYAEELGKGTAKTMTENKVTAEASGPYTTAREELESLENDLSYLKTYHEIFQNAHVFYRNMAKGELA
jgi:hypothetical protein